MRRRVLTPAECGLGGYPVPRGADGIGCGVGCGVWTGGAPAWSIPSALPDAWWLDPVGAPGTLTYVGDPVVSDWTTGTGWAGTGATGPYTHTAGSAGDLTQAVGVVGNRVRVTYTITGRTAGTLTLKAGTTVGTARSTNATFVEGLTVAGSTTVTFAADAAFDGVLTITSVENISIASVAPRQGTGDLANATAASQPWVDSTTGGIRVASDSLVSSLAASAHPYHKAAGFSMFKVLKIEDTAAVHLGGTCSNFNTSNGVALLTIYSGATHALRFYVGNGSGTSYVVDDLRTNTFLSGAKVILEAHHNSTGAVVGVNGSLTSGALTAAHSATDADYPLRIMGRADTGVFGPTGAILYEEVITTGRMTSDEATATRQYLAAKHGITLA